MKHFLLFVACLISTDLTGQKVLDKMPMTFEERQLFLLPEVVRAGMKRPANDLTAEKWLRDSLYLFVGLNAGDIWKNRQRWHFQYDSFGRIIVDENQSWNEETNTWNNFYNTYFKYDNSGRLIERYAKIWSETTETFLNESIQIYEYDNTGKLISLWEKVWKNSTQQWVNSYKSVFEYDISGRVSKNIEYIWEPSTLHWKNEWQGLYTYGISTSDFLQQTWSSILNEWENSSFAVYSYDNQGRQIDYIGKRWDNENNEFKNNERIEANYSIEGNLIQSISYVWQVNAWKNYEKSTYTYRPDNLKESILVENWYSFTNVWGNKQNVNFYYDNAGNEVESSFYKWDAGISTWIKNFKNISYYSNYPITSNQIENIDKLNKIYPNPASSNIIVPPSNSGKIYSIYSLNGGLIESGIVHDEFINISNLKNGNYLLHIKINKKNLCYIFSKKD